VGHEVFLILGITKKAYIAHIPLTSQKINGFTIPKENKTKLARTIDKKNRVIT
jgi:hypothetical protein